ncbi:MAG: Coenzyme F420 hydrogenase/dehydrogenase, beta subunit C-terminal domain [Lachnospiraceae bacterium]|nr:Coenzyme F420 hydrogenase/dehydrogenase, beta subunit C-terminal domain [Lachnospiraceae bacterium]
MLAKKELCVGCGLCSTICPTQCISMQVDDEGFVYPRIDDSRCISCNSCEKACPILQITEVSEKSNFLAVKNKNDRIRENSSSGGVFFEIAQKVLERGGVVCAAGYNNEYSVTHSIARTIEEAHSFCGAKYSQSNFYHCYGEIVERLQRGQCVLFTGTPCQTAALKNNLSEELREQLVLVDMICHGVPSPKVFEEYLEEQRRSFAKDSPLKTVNLRDKTTGWSRYSYCVSLQFENGALYQKKQGEDLFMQGFVNNLYLRPSCENCSFKGVERCSDITLGDFWGIWDIAPDFDDDKGVSLLMIHSPKGQEIWESIREEFWAMNVTEDQAIAQNPSAVSSSAAHAKRTDFFEMIKTGSALQDTIRICLYGKSDKTGMLSSIKSKLFKRK